MLSLSDMSKKRKKRNRIRLEESISELESKLSYQIDKKQKIKEYKSKVSNYLLRVKQLQKLGEKYEKYLDKKDGDNEE